MHSDQQPKKCEEEKFMKNYNKNSSFFMFHLMDTLTRKALLCSETLKKDIFFPSVCTFFRFWIKHRIIV